MRRYLFIALLLLTSVLAEAQIRFGSSRNNTQTNKELIKMDLNDPKEYEIVELTTTGLATLQEDPILSISGLKVGDKIRLPGGQEPVLKKLWKQGIIGDVQFEITKVEGNQISINLAIKERPRMSKFEFKGVNRTQQSELTDKINIRGKVLRDDVFQCLRANNQDIFCRQGISQY